MLARAHPIVIGHRGASGYRPEHTREAYDEAFRLGADAVEPDLVASRDGVLVIRHENEISGTTDVARHPEFAHRRTTKLIDGLRVTGWFTEDFDWAELCTLRARERRPELRPANTAYTGLRLLRLVDLIELIERASDVADRQLGLVAEIKHASYFESIGLPIGDLYCETLAEVGWSNSPHLMTESFERTILDRLRERRAGGALIYLLEAEGAPYDRVISDGLAAADYASDLTDAGLERLAETVNGISVDKAVLLTGDRSFGAHLVDRAHALGLTVFCWTLRPENAYLSDDFRRDATGFGDWRGEYEAILRTGVDGVFADHPDLAIELRNQLFGAALPSSGVAEARANRVAAQSRIRALARSKELEPDEECSS